MILRKHLLLAASAAALFACTTTSQARDALAMDNCIRTFVAAHLPRDSKVEIVKHDTRPGSMLKARGRKFTVSAKSKRTGKVYGTATCTTDRAGAVVALDFHGERERLAKASRRALGAGG